MGIGNHWENKKTRCGHQWGLKTIGTSQKNKKEQNVETNGGEKPLGNQKKTKNKM